MIKEFITYTGLRYKVVSLVNTGAQGMIYKVTRKDKEYVLKVLRNPTKEAWENIKRLCLSGPPLKMGKKDKNFVWPLHYVEEPFKGYVMDYVDVNEYLSLEEMLQVKCSIVDRAELALQFLESMNNLHQSKGMIYGDISQTNIMFHPSEASIKIIDNDNIGHHSGEMLGTKGFLNRALLLGGKPDFNSDLFASYVLMHQLMLFAHPYYGEFAKKYQSMEDGVCEAILQDKGYVFSSKENEIKKDTKAFVVWKHFFTDRLRELFKDIFNKTVRVDVVIAGLREFIDSARVCACGERTSTNICSVCYKTKEGVT